MLPDASALRTFRRWPQTAVLGHKPGVCITVFYKILRSRGHFLQLFEEITLDACSGFFRPNGGGESHTDE